MRRQIGRLLSACALVLAGPVTAQDEPAGNVIVVTAQSSGAPMWTIDTPTGAVIIVGEIKAVPESTPWFPDRLEDATRGGPRYPRR